MEKYRRLTREERYQIAALLQSVGSVRKTARILGRSPSTVSRELRRNAPSLLFEPQQQQQQQATPTSYKPGMAHERALARRSYPRTKKIRGALEQRVRDGLALDWSPEQVAGRLGQRARRKHRQSMISCASIYRFVYRDAALGGSLHLKLRTRRRSSIKRKNVQKCSLFYKAKIVGRVSFRKRPSIIEKRCRIGDFERDTVRCKKSQDPMLLTIVDRTSRLTKIALVERKSSLLIHKATYDLLKAERRVRSITNDNGTEFAEHRETSAALKAPVYFTDPHCSWQRGTNENTNGLIRQYFPKTMDFREITPEQIRQAELRLNSRPRKCLGYRTPIEVHRAKAG